MDYLHEVFRKKRPWKLDNGMAKYLGGFSDTAEYIGKFVNQVKGDEYVPALRTSAATASTPSKSTACA